MITVEKIYNYINDIAPFDTQLSWDNSGLLIGDFSNTVKKAAIALDGTYENVTAAAELGADLLITHHPIIFDGLKSVDSKSAVYAAIKNNLSVISTHTPWDICDFGVNEVLCQSIGLKDVRSLSDNDGYLIKIGRTDKVYSEDEFARFVKGALNVASVKYNKRAADIMTVAVCGGAGADFIELAKSSGADALLSAYIKYHQYLFASELGITVFDAGHYGTENISMSKLKSIIEENFGDIEVVLLDTSDPVEAV